MRDESSSSDISLSSAWSEWQAWLFSILAGIDQSDPFLIRIFEYWARLPEVGPLYASLIEDPRRALSDRAAVIIAASIPMPGTSIEGVVIAHCLLESIRTLLPSQRAFISFPDSATKQAVIAGFNQFGRNLTASGLWEDFLDFADRQMPVFASWTALFRKQGLWNTLFSLLVSTQNVEACERFNLSMLEEKYGRSFASVAEAKIYSTELRLNEALPAILADADPVHYALELFTREHHWPAFARRITQRLLSVSTIGLYELPEIQLFGLMLADFISPSSSGVWFNNPAVNFGHDYSNPVLLDKRMDSVSFSVGESIINALDHVADVVKKIFIDRVDDGLLISAIDEELSENESALRYHLLTYFEEQLIKRFIDNPHCFGFDKTHPLYEDIQNAFSLYKDFRTYRARRGPNLREMLRWIYAYPLLIERKIYTHAPREAMHVKFREAFSGRRADDSLKKLVDQAIAISLRQEMAPLLSFVESLIQSRREDVEELVAVFALGFQRSPRIGGELSSDNTLYLAFSKSLDEDYHALFLDLIWRFCASRLSRFGISRLQVLHSTRRLYRERFGEAQSLDFVADRSIYQFIFRLVLAKIFLTDPTAGLVHPDLVQSFIASIVKLIEGLPSSKAKTTENTALQSLLLKLKSSSPRPLSEAEYLLLERFLLDEHKYSCAESIIAPYGVTTNYLPFMFRRSHPLAVQKDGAALTAGVHKRLVVKPCHRCQMLSSAYLLWQEMNRKWDVDGFEERAMATAKKSMRFFGSSVISTLFSSTTTALVKARAPLAPDAAMNQLFEYLHATFGLERQSIAKDGNCQFTAIAYQLRAVNPARFRALVEEAGFCPDDLKLDQQILVLRRYLRIRVVSHMSAHRTDFDGFVCEDDSSFDDYLATIRQDGPNNWGDNLTLRALKDVLEDFNIVTLRVGMEEDAFTAHHILLAQPFREQIDMARTLVLAYDGSTHYETIRNRPDERLAAYLNHILHPPALAP